MEAADDQIRMRLLGCPYRKRTFGHAQKEDMRRDREKRHTARYKPRKARGLQELEQMLPRSPQGPCPHLVPHFQPLVLRGKTFLPFKPPGLWHHRGSRVRQQPAGRCMASLGQVPLSPQPKPLARRTRGPEPRAPEEASWVLLGREARCHPPLPVHLSIHRLSTHTPRCHPDSGSFGRDPETHSWRLGPSLRHLCPRQPLRGMFSRTHVYTAGEPQSPRSLYQPANCTPAPVASVSTASRPPLGPAT